MSLSHMVLSAYNSKIKLQIADGGTGLTCRLPMEACVRLLKSPGKSIHLQQASKGGKYGDRAAMVGNYDGKGKLSIAMGGIGLPINSADDIVSRESHEIDPTLFEAFCAIFKATLQDEEAVKGIAKMAYKSKVIEIDISL